MSKRKDDDFTRLLKGEISAKEYTDGVKKRVRAVRRANDKQRQRTERHGG